MVPGKSLAIISLTGQVWQPMGMPSGLARRRNAPTVARTPAVAACAAPFLRNARLEIADMCASVYLNTHNVLSISDKQIPRFARDDSGVTLSAER
jgi:hypothetical protein